MYVPDGPLWCWNMQGEHIVFFSQPTVVISGKFTRHFPARGPLAARCQFQTRLQEADGSVDTYPIQCGRMAMPRPDGTYHCTFHAVPSYLECARCEELAAQGETKSCPGCHAVWRDNGWPDWCCGGGESL